MSNTYTAVVFLKNCLVRYEQKCAEFEILPFSGLGLTDEIALLNDYLGKHGFEDLNNADVLSEAGRREQPTAIVRLPNISAVSHIECHDEAVKDAEILSDVLALNGLVTEP